MRELKGLNLTGLTLLGDVVTFDAVSRFSKSMLVRSSFPEEIVRGREFFKWIERRFPGIPKRLMQGNHEARLSKYLLNRAPELGDLPELIFRDLLRIPRHWKVFDWGEFTKEQGVLVQHGKLWGRNTAVRNLLLGCSSVQGHSHRSKIVTHRFAGTGKIITSAELGCLCDFDQGYAKLTDWSHACGFIRDGSVAGIIKGGITRMEVS